MMMKAARADGSPGFQLSTTDLEDSRRVTKTNRVFCRHALQFYGGYRVLQFLV
jgi:hypothetical protein